MAKNPTHWLASVAGVLALAVPKGLCPVCVAASGGVLSSIGLGFLAAGTVIRIVLPVMLLLGLLGLTLSARRHRRWEVLAVGAVGSAALYGGWLLGSRPLLHAGMAVLVLASIGNLWSQRHPRVRAPLVQIRRMRHGEA